MTSLSLGLPIKSRLQYLLSGRHSSAVITNWSMESTANTSSLFPHKTKHGFCRTVVSGTSRGATAAMTRDVKRNLLKLLFGEEYARTDPRNLENYSYEELRKEYLKRLQVIHPDKIHAYSDHRRQSENQQDLENPDPLRSKEDFKKEFQELQSTWDRYEELSKSMMKVVHGDGASSNFTQFGVGCSFSDNEEERALRTEITDQACRGWFSSGLVSSGISDKSDENNDANGKGRIASGQKSLIDDSMFVHAESSENHDSQDSLRQAPKPARRQKRTLIPGIN